MNNKELTFHYRQMYDAAVAAIVHQRYQLDTMLDCPTDNRRGITLLIRPTKSVRKNIVQFLQQIQQIEPEQYYYPETDMHLTVLSIVSCVEGFVLEDVDLLKVKTIIQDTLAKMPRFLIDFYGITASPSCILIQGFPKQETLNLMRERLREAFAQSNLGLSIDARYTLNTAHMTVIRLRKPLQDSGLFCRYIDRYRTFDFGSAQVDTIELVYNDWYQRHLKCMPLTSYPLL